MKPVSAGESSPRGAMTDPAEARRLMGLGIDGIITDAVNRFSPGSAIHD